MASTLVVGTDTYTTLTDARTYIAAQGLSELPTDDTEADVLLRKAAKALDRRWGNRYLGMKETMSQPMAWPRNVGQVGTYRGEGETWGYTIDSDGNPRDFSGYPLELCEAQTEMALLLQDGADQFAQSEAAVTEVSQSVGDLSSTKKYKTAYQTPVFYNIAMLLRPLLVQSYGLKAGRGA